MLDGQKYILDGHKLLWHADRLGAWLKGERIAPITVDCALTRACNYRCVYCYGVLQENQAMPLTRDVIFRFLDDAREIGVKAVSFVSDGESTCSPYFYDAVLRGKQNGLDMAVGTHGTLLKKERLEEILPALTYLRFNVSAAEPARYARVHGCREEYFHKLTDIVRECVKIKKEKNLNVTLGLQMVLMPDLIDQVMPLARLGKELGVDYLVIKHCSDDEFGSLGVDYSKYSLLEETLKAAEKVSTADYLVKVKWSKIRGGKSRTYTRCYGPPFIMQFSGSGLVAPCGMLFNERYKRFHIGNIAETSFKDLWKSPRYWEVIDSLASEKFNARTDCGYLCLQHKVNEFLWDLKNGNVAITKPQSPPPEHINFV
ncbi:MAG: radical SAM protein [Candidatus Omnitrophica bacterium]|nr:radical SAM protein [Candidatus Omnitrophota bacterium]